MTSEALQTNILHCDLNESRTYNALNTMKHGLILSVGSGKTGKSTVMHYFAEVIPNFASRQKLFYENIDVDVSAFPGYSMIRCLDDAPPGSIVFWEDVVRLFPSRGSGNNSLLPKYLSLISHNDIIIVASVQNLMDFDMAALRSQRVEFIHSYMFESDLKYERPEQILQQMTANRRIEDKIREFPDIDPRAFKYCSEEDEVIVVGVPSYWDRRRNGQMFRGVAVCR